MQDHIVRKNPIFFATEFLLAKSLESVLLRMRMYFERNERFMVIFQDCVVHDDDSI